MWVWGLGAAGLALAPACNDHDSVGPHEAASGGAAGAAGFETVAVTPALSNLVVSGVASGLTPTFKDNVRRYSVRASDPAGDVTLTAVADPALEIEIAGERTESGMARVMYDVEPGTAIEIRVSNREGQVRVYTLAYLPFDFPDLKVTVQRPGASTDPIYLALQSGVRHLAKVNRHGVPLFYRKIDGDIRDFKKHPGGEHSYAVEVAENQWEHVVLDSSFREVDRVTAVGLEGTDHHEFLMLENGNFVVLAYVPTLRDLTEFGEGADARVFDSMLQEITPERDVVFEWNSWGHMSYDDSVKEPDLRYEYAHVNSVFVDTDGNWLISARGLAQVLKIDRTTGEVIWRFGGKTNEFTFVDDPYGGFCGQHTATRVDNGNLLLFDNGRLCWPEMPERGEYTRVVEYELDEERKTARLVWSFSHEEIYASSAGSAQRLPNGNTFIGWGNSGQPVLATEVDRDGNVVFELEGRGEMWAARSYRAYRLAD